MASGPSLSDSSDAFTPFELTPYSKVSTINGDEQIDFPKIGSVEVEIMVKLLNQAGLQALNSIDMENKSKNVIDALIKCTINEFYPLPRKRDKLPELVSRNGYVGFLCFVLWVVKILLFSFCLFYFSGVDGSFTGLPPTRRFDLNWSSLSPPSDIGWTLFNSYAFWNLTLLFHIVLSWVNF